MRRHLVALLTSTAVLGLASAAADAQTGQQRAEAAGRELIGTPAPTLVLRTIDGETIDLSRLYGKQAVYLKFWATWCVPCMRQMPHFEHAYETAGPGLAVIALNVGIDDSLENVRKVIQEKHLKMPVVIDDGRLAAAFNLRVTPQHVVIGRDGRIEYVGTGGGCAARPGAARCARALIAGDRVDGVAQADIVRYGVGDALPDLTATTLDGATFRARDASGRRRNRARVPAAVVRSVFHDLAAGIVGELPSSARAGGVALRAKRARALARCGFGGLVDAGRAARIRKKQRSEDSSDDGRVRASGSAHST